MQVDFNLQKFYSTKLPTVIIYQTVIFTIKVLYYRIARKFDESSTIRQTKAIRIGSYS